MGQEQLPPLSRRAFELYPTLADLYGYAAAEFDGKAIVFGGLYRSDVPGYDRDFPNTDLIVIDYWRGRAIAFNAGSFAYPLNEQLGSRGMAYYQDGNTLYLLGGYGYSEHDKRKVTFPYLTVVKIRETVDALLHGEKPDAYFYQICDENMAIFDGQLDFNGDEFFLVHGKYAYQLSPFSNQPETRQESYRGQVRTFRLERAGLGMRITDYKQWTDSRDFLDFYKNLVPGRADQALDSLGIRRVN